MENTVQKRIACLTLPLTVGGLSALLTRKQYTIVRGVRKKTAFTPAEMAVQGCLDDPVCPDGDNILSGSLGKAQPDGFHRLQRPALFHFVWPISLFQPGTIPVYLYLACDFVTVLVPTALFYRISKLAGHLMLPYLVWVTFSGYYLNFAIYLLNQRSDLLENIMGRVPA